MKEGAPAGKRSVANPCFPSAKEGGIEGREGILGGSPALSMERITALCSREIHPPVRAGQSLPGPGGEGLRWANKAVVLPYPELYFHGCSKENCISRSALGSIPCIIRKLGLH